MEEEEEEEEEGEEEEGEEEEGEEEEWRGGEKEGRGENLRSNEYFYWHTEQVHTSTTCTSSSLVLELYFHAENSLGMRLYRPMNTTRGHEESCFLRQGYKIVSSPHHGPLGVFLD